MTSITIVVSDREHRVPGFAVEAVADLACMHDPTVRQWIVGHRGDRIDADILIADPGWVNPGDGTESLTFPVVDRDAEIVAARWAKLKTGARRADETGG